tara:strand:+ start:793 stop:1050 length:258 start_codon:yes stop_codon:yes gene_type:complete
MENKKTNILLLPCYEHDIREYVKRCNAHIPLTPVYQLTPDEEKEFQEENKRAKLLDKLESGESIDEKDLDKDEKFLIWKMRYLKP